MKSLLSIDTNAKTVKGQKKGYKTGILYLAPASVSGVVNVCIFASASCNSACLYSAGRGAFTSVQQARINKTKLFVSDKHAFVETLKVAPLARAGRGLKLPFQDSSEDLARSPRSRERGAD